MHDVLGTVYLEWSPTRSGVVVRGDGRHTTHVAAADLQDKLGKSIDTIVVRHYDGPELAAAAVSAVVAGRAKSAQIESDYGHRTVLTGTAVATLAVWRTANPTGHPAAKVAAYASGTPTALAAVIGNLFDPKWYRDADRPARHAAAEARLGLTPRWDNKNSTFRQCLTGAWMTGDKSVSDPANFFGRMFIRLACDKGDAVVAERLVGRYFLKCLIAAWLDADRPAGSERLFDPPLLFDAKAVEAVSRGT